MSLVISPQPDGSIIVRSGDNEVVIPPRSGEPSTAGIPKPPPLPIPGSGPIAYGTVVVHFGPGPADSVRPDVGDVTGIVEALPEGVPIVSVELATWPEQGIDVEALMSATRKRLGPEVSIDLHFLSEDDSLSQDDFLSPGE